MHDRDRRGRAQHRHPCHRDGLAQPFGRSGAKYDHRHLDHEERDDDWQRDREYSRGPLVDERCVGLRARDVVDQVPDPRKHRHREPIDRTRRRRDRALEPAFGPIPNRIAPDVPDDRDVTPFDRRPHRWTSWGIENSEHTPPDGQYMSTVTRRGVVDVASSSFSSRNSVDCAPATVRILYSDGMSAALSSAISGTHTLSAVNALTWA